MRHLLSTNAIYGSYVFGGAKILYGVAGYLSGSFSMDQALEQAKEGLMVLFFTKVGTPPKV